MRKTRGKTRQSARGSTVRKGLASSSPSLDIFVLAKALQHVFARDTKGAEAYSDANHERVTDEYLT